MSLLTPLLEVQAQDLAADAARQRSAELPERATLPLLATRGTEIGGRLAAARTDLAERQAEEERIGAEVSRVVAEIEASDVDYYSGKRKGRDDAEAHEEAQQRLRETKGELEEREMTLLEEIEALTIRIEEIESEEASNRVESERLAEAVRKVEAEVAVEIERLGAEKTRLAAALPDDVVVAYERVRAQPRKGGRGAAPLADGRCGACRISLPKLEYARMLAEPDEAVIQCPQCRRVLVR